MTKHTYNHESIKVDDTNGCIDIPVRYRTQTYGRKITANDLDNGIIGGSVFDPESGTLTGTWVWDTKHQPNIWFTSFKEVDEDGNFRLCKGGNQICGAIRRFIVNNMAA